MSDIRYNFVPFKNINNRNSLGPIFENIYAPKLNSMGYMFSNCRNLKNISFINFESPNIKFTERMFNNCINLNYTKLEGILHKISFSKLESLNSFILENITFLELVNINGMLSGKHPNYYISFKNLNFPKLTSMIFLYNGGQTYDYNYCRSDYNNLYYFINFENIDLPNVLTLENSFFSSCFYQL